MIALWLALAHAGDVDPTPTWGVPTAGPELPLMWRPATEGEQPSEEDSPLPSPFVVGRARQMDSSGEVSRGTVTRVHPQTGELLVRRGPRPGVRIALGAGGVLGAYALSALVASAGDSL